MRIDSEKLRKELKNDDYGAFFVGGFGGAILNIEKINKMTDAELIDMAKIKNIDLRRYQK